MTDNLLDDLDSNLVSLGRSYLDMFNDQRLACGMDEWYGVSFMTFGYEWWIKQTDRLPKPRRPCK